MQIHVEWSREPNLNDIPVVHVTAAEVCQLFKRTLSFGRIFTSYRKNVRKPNNEVAQVRLEIKYSNRALLAQEDDIEMTLLQQTGIQKYRMPCQMDG
jgi:hypothetical protein